MPKENERSQTQEMAQIVRTAIPIVVDVAKGINATRQRLDKINKDLEANAIAFENLVAQREKWLQLKGKISNDELQQRNHELDIVSMDLLTARALLSNAYYEICSQLVK